jgi:hypothetical protein
MIHHLRGAVTRWSVHRRGHGSGFDRFLGKKLNLSHQKALFIGELIIIRPILQEFRKEFMESIPIVDQYPLHSD